MEKELRVQDTTSDDLVAKLRSSWKRDLDDLKRDLQPKPTEEYLTRNEVSQMLKVDLSTVHNWTKEGKLRRFGIGKRIYYKRSDVENALVEIRAPKRI